MTEKPNPLRDTYEQLANHEADMANDERMDFTLRVSDFFSAQKDLFEQIALVMDGDGPSEDEVFSRIGVAFKVTAETFADAVLAAEAEGDSATLAATLEVQFSRQLRDLSERYGAPQVVPVQSTRMASEHYESILSQYDADDDALVTTDFDAAGDPAVFTGLASEFHTTYHEYVGGLLNDAPANHSDVARGLRADVKKHALDVAKVALGAAIAGAALRLLRR